MPLPTHHGTPPRPRDTDALREQQSGPRVLAWGVLMLGAWILAALTAWCWL